MLSCAQSALLPRAHIFFLYLLESANLSLFKTTNKLSVKISESVTKLAFEKRNPII